ncbi:DNA mismatch repair protein Msh3 [Fimicolochytrium jonesii]|uniref:DNA mismatch repair protein Msh3 n=1 Tax=Fimicolochytrium jonesii TaxID=1396493 RepID=UPI0022FDEC87|nr:DNA mismatch repair protein Msh3 [Fimicolochytrium jonesii]KAI8815766.1 DNA mismatch repair protein Msh3 [Fimicolochytrium jonesii]
MSKRKSDAGLGSSAAKKKAKTLLQQPTISSFFRPKPDTVAPTPAVTTTTSTPTIPTPTKSLHFSASLQNDDVHENDENRGVKRRRSATPEPEDSRNSVAAISEDMESPLPKQRKGRLTRRFIYSDDEDDEDFADAAAEDVQPTAVAPTQTPESRSDGGQVAATSSATNGGVHRLRRENYRFDKRVLHTNGTAPASGLASADGHETSAPPPSSNPERERVRSRFLEKFTVDERALSESEPALGTPDEGDDDAESPQPSSAITERFKPLGKATKKGATAKSKAATATKYTPLEQQFLDIKRANPDCLLVVEVGYKFRFFGDDAKIAAKELNIVAYKDHSMFTAGIPTHRLHVHVQKLVQLGYKVGIVRQMETAALKAAGDNKNAPFVRQLTNVYTKGTFVDDLDIDADASAGFDSRASSYLMCVVEDVPTTQSGAVHFGLVAIQLQTGDIVFDEFEDNHMRNELETRMLHIRPTEIILPETLSSVTEKLVRYLCGSGDDGVRVERIKGGGMVEHIEARRALAAFYDKKISQDGGKEHEPASGAQQYSQALSLPKRVIIALAHLLTYLTQFNLQSALYLTTNFTPFSNVAHMVLNANTLRSLEVFENGDDGGRRGSLWWVLDQTRTRFGARLMRRWVGMPLVDVGELQKRTDAVEELLEKTRDEDPYVMRGKGLLHQLPDLERSIARIHYARISPAELFTTLLAFEKITTCVPRDAYTTFKSELLQNVYRSLPVLRREVERFKGVLDEEAARRGDKVGLFVDDGGDGVDDDGEGDDAAEGEATPPRTKWPEITHHQQTITKVESDLTEHLHTLRKTLKKPTLNYTTVAGIEYLVELPISQTSKVPHDWVKISSTKSLARFHTPGIISLMRARDRARESLVAACEKAYLSFLAEVAGCYEGLRSVVGGLAVLDCLGALVVVAGQPGYVRPVFGEGVEVVGGRHPMVEGLVEGFVDNDVVLTKDSRCLLITGPNMGGKSSYVRQVALIAIMAQIGSYVPAKSARLGIFDAVYTRMGASDSLATGQSTFMRELQETSDILRTATPRSLVILDELGRGTSTHDGTAIAYAVLAHFLTVVNCATLFVTHYPVLGNMAAEFGGMRCCHMGFCEVDQGEGQQPTIVFLYKLTAGLAHRSYGLNVARLANLPAQIVAQAGEKARELERVVEGRRARRSRAGVGEGRRYELVKKVFGGTVEEALEGFRRDVDGSGGSGDGVAST